MQANISEALTEAGFTEADLSLVATAEKKEGLVQNWAETTFKDVLGAIPGTAAFAIVRKLRTPSAPTVEQSVTLPERPPYLYDRDGKQIAEYDPSDPSQYWESPTGELWRWDGKRDRMVGAKAPTVNLMGYAITKTRFPYGEPRRVMVVRHTTVNGIAVPDAKDVTDARLGNFDWFHLGLGMWVSGAKPLRPVDPSIVRRLKDAMASLGGGNPAIVRG